MKHIGIVGCSAEGAALCYKTICLEGAEVLGRHAHPEISMHTHSLEKYVTCLESDDLAGVAELMLSSAAKLAAAGAEFIICPDNTIHAALPIAEQTSPLPWLHIAGVVADAAVRGGFKRLGVLGTKWLVESDVYPQKLKPRGIQYEIPGTAERKEIDRIIFEELVYGDFRPQSIAYHQSVIAQFKAKGCDAVVLGCTEIPLIMSDSNSTLPTLDSTRLLARAALDHAVAG